MGPTHQPHWALDESDGRDGYSPQVLGLNSPYGYSCAMSRVLKWNGQDVPEELRSLPAGRYIVEAVDDAPALTPEEEAGLVEALEAIDRGEGESAQKVRRAVGRTLKR